MSFTKEDLAKYRGVKQLIEKGTFDLEGKAVMAAAFLFSWFNELEAKIEESIKKPMKPKEVKEPVKPMAPKTKKGKK